jgi:hypothetical protein
MMAKWWHHCTRFGAGGPVDRQSSRTTSVIGVLPIKSHQVFLCRPLLNEYIDLEATADGIWTIYFYDTVIAR